MLPRGGAARRADRRRPLPAYYRPVSKRLFILDGHNIIFALGALQSLQTSERGEEARTLLIESLEGFARRRGDRVLVVFDGRGPDGPASGPSSSLVEVVYSRGTGGADRLILDEAGRRAERGEAVTVVTDDVRTLARLLPRGVRRVDVRTFWQEQVEPPDGDDEKPVAGNFSDIERQLLALEPASRPAPGGARRTSGADGTARRSPDGAARSRPLSDDELRREQILRKRERGRLRHARRLKRRAGS